MAAVSEKRVGVHPADAVRARPDGTVELAGRRCENGDYTTLAEAFRCPRCFGAMQDAAFPPRGTVWSYTTIAVSSPTRSGGYTLAYIDLDGGPRILSDVAPGSVESLAIGDTVDITVAGDYLVATTTAQEVAA